MRRWRGSRSTARGSIRRTSDGGDVVPDERIVPDRRTVPDGLVAPEAFAETIRRQLARLADAIANGMPRVGWKICVNDPRAQKRLGLAEPFVGWLDGARIVASGERYPVRAGTRLACEPEIAIRIGAAEDSRNPEGGFAITAAAPALEVIDYARASPDLATVVETSSFHDGVVLGRERSPDAAPQLSAECPRLTRNGETVGTTDPSLVAADLALIVHHVAEFLTSYGQGLRPGDLILSGACAAPVMVTSGDEIAADFGPLGIVRVVFV